VEELANREGCKYGQVTEKLLRVEISMCNQEPRQADQVVPSSSKQVRHLAVAAAM
jgi:hypothetical protein